MSESVGGMNHQQASKAIGEPMALVKLLEKIDFEGSEEIKENYKLLLCMAAGGLAPRGAVPTTPERAKAFEIVIKSLEKLALTGSEWVGRPEIMTAELFAQLKLESDECKLISKATDRYHLAKAGPVAQQLAKSQDLAKFISTHYPGVSPTGIGTYIYYDKPGDGLDPHVDTEIYAVNAIIMIDHKFDTDPSHLLLYKDGVEPKKILLRPGEIAIINAGSVVHAREDMKRNENVHILTIGFA